MITYNNTSTILVTKIPSVEFNVKLEFNDNVPMFFIHEFILRMSRGQIKVKDCQGNELKVYIEE